MDFVNISVEWSQIKLHGGACIVLGYGLPSSEDEPETEMAMSPFETREDPTEDRNNTSGPAWIEPALPGRSVDVCPCNQLLWKRLHNPRTKMIPLYARIRSELHQRPLDGRGVW